MAYIKGFDGLRAVSIIMVILTHLGLYEQLSDNTFLKNNYNLISGSTGVMIFFTISGFLITSILLTEKNKSGTINVKRFFLRRIMRLMPVLLIFYTIIILLMLSELIPKNRISLLFSILYIYNFIPIKYNMGELGHTWSLAVEEQFYLFWPFIILLVNKKKSLCLIAVLMISLCIMIYWFWEATPNFNIFLNYKNNFFPLRWFIPACLPIMLGALFCIIREKLILFLSNTLVLKLIPYLCICGYFIQLIILNVHILLILISQSISIALLLFWITVHQGSRLVQFFEIRILKFIGKISYGIYVYQGLFLRTGPIDGLVIQKFPLNVILLIPTSIISYYLIEKKVLSLKNRLFEV